MPTKKVICFRGTGASCPIIDDFEALTLVIDGDPYTVLLHEKKEKDDKFKDLYRYISCLAFAPNSKNNAIKAVDLFCDLLNINSNYTTDLTNCR